MVNISKIWKNQAIVCLRKCGFSFYAIQKAFEAKDKRNIIRVWKRDKNKYFLPSEKLEKFNNQRSEQQ